MTNLVINTSSSLFFTKIGIIPILLKNFGLVTSEEVVKEMKEGETLGYKDARIIMQYINDGKIKITKANKTNKLVKEFKLKEADASVISLAQELNCFLATEDKQIEKICLITGTKITNTAVLIVYLLKKNYFKEDQALLLLDLLIRNGYNKEICLMIKEKILGGKNV